VRALKRDFARQLRKSQTEAERKVWDLLKNRKLLGLKFRRQHVIEGFVVDFYCLERKLAIEIDGGIHDRRRDYDELRQQEIESKSNTVIRVRNEELKDNCVVLIQRIKEAISSKE
jgi:very-short-patch-repair endonuclease